MMTVDSLVEEIATIGFSVVERVIKPDDVTRLRSLLAHCIDEDVSTRGKEDVDYSMVHNLMARHVEFALLIEDETIQQHLCDLLGHGCIIYSYTSSSLRAHDTNYSHRVHVDCPRVIPNYMTNVGVILALDDFSVENGATLFLPGSFHQLDAPSMDEFTGSAQHVFPRAGDAVFFNARTWHMGGVNRTSQDRHAVTMNVCRAYMRQRFDYPRLVPQEIVDQLTDVGRRFLGFNVRMPISLDEYYSPASGRLYKPGQE